MMIIKRNDTETKDLGEGVTRRILNRGGSLMIVEFCFKKGAIGALHSHPHEQIGCITSGSGFFTIDGKETEIKAGDSMYMPPNAIHSFVSHEDNTIILDIFTPQREDFIDA
jgi:quercetin dioxygenase-like cupin family protein